jgi:hypothetical protein
VNQWKPGHGTKRHMDSAEQSVYQDAIPERDAHAQRHCDETQQRGAKRIEGCDPFEIQARSWVPFDDQGRWQ